MIQIFGDVLGHGVMLGMDEPVHGRLRSLVTKAFTQKALARWEDEIVGRIGNELIDSFAQDGKTDLVKTFTFPYPTRIIAALLGLPEKDLPQFQRWSISMLSFTVNPERGMAASQALVEYFKPILQTRRAEPREDLISSLAQPRSTGTNSPTRTSSPSSSCCCRPEWRRRIGRWATCCSACCRTRTNSTRCARTAR